jgi:hypothetical protein
MKKYFLSLAVLTMAMSLTTACSSDDNNEPAPVVETVTPYHFDITVTVGQQGGMSRKVTTIMHSVDSLNSGADVNFVGEGSEINATYSMETILKGKYYYQVPFSADRFTKFRFEGDRVKVVQEQKFQKNTYSTRSYTHAWVNDSVLVIMAANGDKNAIVWTKLNANDMRIMDEGTLDISLTDDWTSFTTSGILAYRHSDNKLFYFYYLKKGSGRSAKKESHFRMAVINAETMAVERNTVNSEANEPAGSAYGELLQQTVFFDESDNLYLVCFNDEEQGEMGRLLRIRAGEYDFERGYNGFPNPDGKLLTVQYLGGGKVFCYSRNDVADLGTSIDSYAHYYSVIDLNTKTRTRMAYQGAALDYSSGRFAQRSAYVAKENKVYFGVNTETAQPAVYIYDVATGQVTKGVNIAEGYYFEQLRVVEDESYTIQR